MHRFAFVLAVCLSLGAGFSTAESKDKDLQVYLAGVTERGRALYAYDQAAWHGTDAFLALHPDTKGLAHYICRNSASGWVVSFGKWNEAHDRFFIVYEATEAGHPGTFVARRYDPPAEVTDDLPAIERALELVIADFPHQSRPYNTAILPAPGGNLYVYLYPGQTIDTVWPLGGDGRYTVSPDGKQIVEKRQLHKTILDLEFKPGSGIVGGAHSHVLSEVPEDTDVLYVLTRRPSMPEYIGTQRRVFVVNPDGTIAIAKK
jgi:hypothetical protein